MISLVLPYWDRQAAADKAFAILEKQYAGLDLEVVVVDDGNPVPFKVPETSLKVVVVRLPTKTEPKCPATAWNAGAHAASGDVIALSCVEILHDRGPVLPGMLEALEQAGPRGYILAAAWCPEQGLWHAHSSVEVPQCPTGTGIAFLAMLRKELFERAGGFDEAYREGAGYEDRDFIYRLTMAGAKFVKRDDLAVTHPKTGAAIDWGDRKFLQNQALFEKNWLSRRRVTFACVQSKNYCGRGAEYVNKLFDMVKRNLPEGILFRFVCLTDDPKGLDDSIDTIALPEDVLGWYGKLYLFKRGLFPDGERVVFMDLDTVIVGKLDDLITYDGQFATLTDFYFPERIGPAVMAFEAGAYVASIWSEWETSGKPEDTMGDLWWLNNLDQGRFAKNADRLQKLYPEMFVSFKRHCAPLPPKGAKVVCFHGKPRPHEAEDEWVAMAWQVGGSVNIEREVVANTSYTQTAANIAAACKRPLSWLPQFGPIDQPAAIVGGGPSLVEMLPELKERASHGVKVFAVNGAHDFLVRNGLVPDAHVIIDARPENAVFITARAKAYFLASQCAPEVFDKAGPNTTLVHMNTRGVLASIPDSIQPINLISSGCTVGLAALAIAYVLGHRHLYVYGMDSSYEEGRHAYEQDLNAQDRVEEVIAGGRKFKAAPWMVAQVQDFQKLALQLAQDDCVIEVRCGGLLGHVAWLETRAAA